MYCFHFPNVFNVHTFSVPQQQTFPSLVTSILENSCSQENTEVQSKLWSALVCLPHVRCVHLVYKNGMTLKTPIQ